MECIRFEHERKYIKDFLELPKILYTKETNMENPKEIEELLRGKHPLSNYFSLHKFLVYDKGKVVGRFVLTTYPDDEVAYIGFFECINEKAVAMRIFQEADVYTKQWGKKKLVGPVYASFWIKYRLKINLFDKQPYTGEPYNKDYYFQLFKDNGFVVSQHYTSNIYSKVDVVEGIYEDRYNNFLRRGYEIISPEIEDFEKVIQELYKLITDLYSDFPIYKEVSYKDFAKVFSDYRYIINMSMVKMAYYNGKAVGFFISVPDYGNRVYHLRRLKNLMEVFLLKKKPKRYIMLYMGVHTQHCGLGKALVGSNMKELKQSGLPSIGALARDGKITQKYGEEHIEQCYEYVLMEKELDK